MNDPMTQAEVKTCDVSMERIKKMSFGKGAAYEMPELQQVKQRLNTLKSNLDNIDIGEWKKFTSMTDRSRITVNAVRDQLKGGVELVTNAWCKMYEMIMEFSLITHSNFNSVHLCECPGGFICATNHALHQTYPRGTLTWMAVSLNPYYEGNDMAAMVDDDIFYSQTEDKWYKGADDSGNILRMEFFQTFKEVLVKRKNFAAHLVTADGSIDVQFDANRQEEITAGLHFTEMLLSLRCLRQGGSMVLKAFTMFEHHSVSLMYICSLVFRELKIVKPRMSRPGNSEVYVLGQSYRLTREDADILCDMLSEFYGVNFNPDVVIVPEADMPKEFRESFIRASCYMSECQIKTMEAREAEYKAGVRPTKRVKPNPFDFFFYGPHEAKPIQESELLSGVSGKVTHSFRQGNSEKVQGVQADRSDARGADEALQLRRKNLYRSKKCLTIEYAFDDEDWTDLPDAEAYEPPPQESESPQGRRGLGGGGRGGGEGEAAITWCEPFHIDNINLLINTKSVAKSSVPTPPYHFRMSRFAHATKLTNVIRSRTTIPDGIHDVTDAVVPFYSFSERAECEKSLPSYKGQNLASPISADLAQILPLCTSTSMFVSANETPSSTIPFKHFCEIAHVNLTDANGCSSSFPLTRLMKSVPDAHGRVLVFGQDLEKEEVLGHLNCIHGSAHVEVHSLSVADARGFVRLAPLGEGGVIFLDASGSSPNYREIAQSEKEIFKTLVQLLDLARKTSENGATWIIRHRSAFLRPINCIMVALSNCFEAIGNIRPKTTPPWTQISYTVCKNLENANAVIDFFRFVSSMTNQITVDICQLIPAKYFINERYLTWINGVNNGHCEQEVAYWGSPDANSASLLYVLQHSRIARILMYLKMIQDQPGIYDLLYPPDSPHRENVEALQKECIQESPLSLLQALHITTDESIPVKEFKSQQTKSPSRPTPKTEDVRRLRDVLRPQQDDTSTVVSQMEDPYELLRMV